MNKQPERPENDQQMTQNDQIPKPTRNDQIPEIDQKIWANNILKIGSCEIINDKINIL